MQEYSYGKLPTLQRFSKKLIFRRSMIFGALILIALVAFELFNYSTTDYALSTALGDIRFLGIRWTTILAIAFCGIDFAGVARLFTPQRGGDEPVEVWYLFGAWLLAAGMNAVLTWWGVSTAIANHQTLGNAVIDRQTLLKVVPVFVAIMVWLIRILIIGAFSVAGEHLFGVVEVRSRSQAYLAPITETDSAASRPRALVKPAAARPAARRPVVQAVPRRAMPGPAAQPAQAFRPSPKVLDPEPPEPEPVYAPIEPTYHPISASSGSQNSAKRL